MRRYDDAGVVLPHGGATIAYKVTKEIVDEVADPKDDDMALYFLDIGIAKCRATDNIRDIFCKRIGRDIATARMLEATEGLTFTHHPSHSEVIKAVKEHYYLVRSAFLPQIRLMEK